MSQLILGLLLKVRGTTRVQVQIEPVIHLPVEEGCCVFALDLISDRGNEGFVQI